jgi:hypothetical protein
MSFVQLTVFQLYCSYKTPWWRSQEWPKHVAVQFKHVIEHSYTCALVVCHASDVEHTDVRSASSGAPRYLHLHHRSKTRGLHFTSILSAECDPEQRRLYLWIQGIKEWGLFLHRLQRLEEIRCPEWQSTTNVSKQPNAQSLESTNCYVMRCCY